MPIITISRGSYSKGKEIAEKVAERLGYDCISREILLNASKRFNIPEIKLIHAIHDAPSILERFNQSKQTFIAYIRNALVQRVKDDNVVYHGLAGHLLLPGIPNILKVRITSTIEDRLATEMQRRPMTREKALEILLKDDLERRKWTKTLYGVDPWDSSLYDLTIKIKRFTVDNAVDFICEAAALDQFKQTELSRRKMEDLSIASEIKVSLVEKFPSVMVKCEYGNVIIYIKGDEKTAKSVRKELDSLKEKIHGINNIEVHAGTKPPSEAI